MQTSSFGTEVGTNNSLNGSKVCLEITKDLVSRLIDAGYLKPCDFRCLDTETKNFVKTLCLSRCAQKLGLLD